MLLLINYFCIGCFDLLLDAEKAKDGIEIPMDNGYMGMGGGGMFMAAGTPSMSPAMTPWDQTSTPIYQNSWSSSMKSYIMYIYF